MPICLPRAPFPCPGEYDLRGVRGNEDGVDARFTSISLEGTFDTQISQQDLDRIAQQATKGAGCLSGLGGQAASRPDLPSVACRWTNAASWQPL